MNAIFFRDSKNKVKEAKLVRYFSYGYHHYLLYTFNEVDEKNFVKLYVVNVLEELGSLITRMPHTDFEWQKVQDIVKTMLKEIKHNLPYSFHDLDSSKLKNIKIEEARSFKLLKRLVYVLSGEKNVDFQEKEVNDSHSSINNIQQNNASLSVDAMNHLVSPDLSSISENKIVEDLKTKKEKDSIYHITPIISFDKSVESKAFIPTESISSNIEKKEQDNRNQSLVKDKNSIIDNKLSILSSDDDINNEIYFEDDWQKDMEKIDEIVSENPENFKVDTIQDSMPEYKPFQEESSNKAIDDIALSTNLRMIKLENERLKTEIKKLHKELKAYKNKYDKIKDFIQKEI